MAITPYLKLQKPPFDTIPWDAALNGNMDILDGYISRYMSTPNFVGAWTNSTAYVVGQTVLDTSNSFMYSALVTHTSAASPTTFAQDRASNPSYWAQLTIGSPGAGFAPLVSPAFTGDPTTPTASPGDNDTSIASTAFVHGEVATAQAALTPSYNNMGRNLLHNSKFNIAQRGLGPFTANGVYTLDRWFVITTLDTISYTGVAATDSARTQIGDEAAVWTLQNTFTGNAGATAFNLLSQRIENVRRLGGKTVTLSFWANASAPIKLGFNVSQSFGTGGSPSTGVRALTTGNQVTVGTTWARYSTTIALPSTIGKTLGTNGNDYTAIEIYFSSGANNNQLAGNVGVQSGTVSLWGMQLEVSSVMTQFEQIDQAADWQNCQRFYTTLIVFAIGYNGGAGGNIYGTYALPVVMRSTPPNVVLSGASYTNASALVVYNVTNTSLTMQATVTAIGQGSGSASALISAEL